MELHNLKPAKGATHHDKRVGRGAGSGRGGYSGRGNKGAQSRSGYKSKLGFEGGQMPLQRRLPKFGFTNLKRVEYKAINLDTLETLAEARQLTRIAIADLRAAGLVPKNKPVKILGNGAITRALEVEADGFSKAAEEAITAAGGKAIKTTKK